MNGEYGYCRVAACIPEVIPGAPAQNAAAAVRFVDRCASKKVDVAVFPALFLTGVSCGDLFASDEFLDETLRCFQEIFLRDTESFETVAFIGLPLRSGGEVYSCVAACSKGKVVALYPAQIPAAGERVFAQIDCGNPPSFDLGAAGVHQVKADTVLRLNGDDRFTIQAVSPTAFPRRDAFCAAILLEPCAEMSRVESFVRRRALIRARSAEFVSAWVSVNAGRGESTADGVYAGEAVIAENGEVSASRGDLQFDTEDMICVDIDVAMLSWRRRRATVAKSFDRSAVMDCVVGTNAPMDGLLREIKEQPFLPDKSCDRSYVCEELLKLQSAALAMRIKRTGCKRLVLGISGGLDSTVALFACVEACDRLGMDRKSILAITMPGFGTTDRTHDNSVRLCRGLGVENREISIGPACLRHFEDIGHDSKVHDTVFENVQARERTQILMDVANQCGGIVIGTGDMSENALGWCTYNGDHMSMYAINASLPKTVIRAMVAYCVNSPKYSDVRASLQDILETPVSPELLPAGEDGNIVQKTENELGPYEVHDFILYGFLAEGASRKKLLFLLKQAFGARYAPEMLERWLGVFFRRFFTQQFKRACQPDAPMLLDCSISARNAWVMPSDVSGEVFWK